VWVSYGALVYFLGASVYGVYDRRVQAEANKENGERLQRIEQNQSKTNALVVELQEQLRKRK
jgi:hypothetical protein